MLGGTFLCYNKLQSNFHITKKIQIHLHRYFHRKSAYMKNNSEFRLNTRHQPHFVHIC